MSRTAVIIGGGDLSEEFALRFFAEHTWDYLIAADRGLLFLKEAGILPTHIVGDFDSAGIQEEESCRKLPGVEVCRLNPVKDITDTRAALDLACGLDCARIYLLGCTGRRMDHTVAAVRDLRVCLEQGREGVMLDPWNRIRLISSRVILRREEQYGKYVSLFAIGGPVKGLTLRGFRYPLENYVLDGLSALGVSNELEAEEGEIDMKAGILLLIESKDGEE